MSNPGARASSPRGRARRAALAYLAVAFPDPQLDLGRVATHAAVTPTHLAHLFTQHTGRTFLQHLRAHRIAHAQRLLRSPAMSIKAAAYDSGYRYLGRFRRDFHRVQGVAASVWRGTLP